VGRRPSAPSSQSSQVPSIYGPGHSRGQEGGGSTELFAAVSFGRSRSGAPLRPTPFQRRGCELPLDLLGPRGAFTEPCRPSDVLLVTRGHARSASVPTDALSASPPRRLATPDDEPEIDLRAEGPCVVLPVRAIRAKAREHLPSYREPASRNPQAERARTFNRERSSAYRFAVYLLVLSVREGFRASFWLAPWLSTRPCDLPEDKTRDASDRLLPPER